MRIGSLFSGIGGLELGLERGLLASGLVAEVVYQVERSSFCRHILARHWPAAARYEDVCSVGAAVLPPVDLLCGGFPCQDVSSAGKGAGLDGARSGLWWEFLRIIGETRPRWVVIENVASGASRWLPAVRRSLWTRGYASLPVGIAACEVGARHRRERIFVVAAADLNGPWQLQSSGSVGEGRGRADHGTIADPDLLVGNEGEASAWTKRPGRPEPRGGAPTHPDRSRPSLGECFGGDPCPSDGQTPERDAGAVSPWQGLPPRPWMVRGVYGLPGGVDRYRWRVAGWTSARVRTARIQALGNAVVPAQVEPIGQMIGTWEQALRGAA